MHAPAGTTFHQDETQGKARRVLPIEEALRWMARDELPKAKADAPITAPPTSSMHPMWRGGIFGARIQNWNREPGMPAAMGDPHPDALRLNRAIRELRADTLDLSGYRITHGLTKLDPRIPVAEICAQALEHAKGWLLTCAVRGSVPDHGCGAIFEPHKGSRGQVTLWLDVQKEVGKGADGQPWYAASHETTTPNYGGEFKPEKGSQYKKGTFCKLRFTREARDVAMDRAIYAAWHAASCRLVEMLSGMEDVEVEENGRRTTKRVWILSSLDLRPPVAPATPWIHPPRAPAVLLSLAPLAEEAPSEPAKREMMPPRNPRLPVRHLDPAAWSDLRAAA